MENTNWSRQTPEQPFFKDLLWSRPENRRHAGKLLIVGGNVHAMTAPGMAYSAAEKAGAGTVRVLLPDSTQKTLGKVFPEAEFAPSTPSGSFSREALSLVLELANWADGILLAGDFGRNSETAILLDSFVKEYRGQLTAAQDGLDYFLHKNSAFFERENTLAVINFGKLQKLAQNNRPEPPVKYSMNLHQLVDVLLDWKINLITAHGEQFVVSSTGKVSTTPTENGTNWQIELAAYAAVWWLQQPKKPFEALTTAVFDYIRQVS